MAKWSKPENEEDAEKEPQLVACVWVTKAKAVDCSNLNWLFFISFNICLILVGIWLYEYFRDDDALIAYEKNVAQSKKFAVLGRNQVVKFISKNQVKRISLAGNKIENLETVEKLASHTKNSILELSIA